MPESEILSQRNIHDLDSNRDKLPALLANVGLVATRSHIIVVCKINIEDQLFLDRAEGSLAECFAVARVRRVDGSDLETGGVEAENIFAETGIVRVSRSVK